MLSAGEREGEREDGVGGCEKRREKEVREEQSNINKVKSLIVQFTSFSN